MRLLTRSDYDGLACGALLLRLGVIDSWKFVHPKDMQDGLIEVTSNDIICNVPHVPGCGIWFDHHSSEIEKTLNKVTTPGLRELQPSCARNVYNFYNCDSSLQSFADMIRAVDKVDSADLDATEIESPTGWILLGFIMDPRTGLGRFKNFTVSNYQLMEQLMHKCCELSIDEILNLPDVQERVAVYNEQNQEFRAMLKRYTTTEGSVIITDLRNEDVIFAGNRFLLYTMFPNQNASIWITWGREKKNIAIAAGHSIINRTCQADIGKLVGAYGGGGHRKVGTCQVEIEKANSVIQEIINELK